MTEVLGIASAVFTIAESCLRVGSSLWKLGKSLKMAGHNVREISTKVKLTAKILKQIAPKLAAGGISLKDLCLIQEVVVVCQERVVEADQLLNVLEAEINYSGSNLHVLLGKVKFIFHQSKFVLLERDLNSLLITLQLLVGVIDYEETRLNRQLSDEIRQDLQSLKEVVEQDMLYHKVDELLHCLLTLEASQSRDKQFDHMNNRSEDSASDTASSSAVTISANRYSVHAQKNLAPSSDEIRSLSSIAAQSMLQIDVSKTVEVFTQTQIVQKGAVRRAEEELQSTGNVTHDPHMDDQTSRAETTSLYTQNQALHAATSPLMPSEFTEYMSTRRVSTAGTINSGVGSMFSSDRSQTQSSMTDNHRYTISSFDFEKTPPHSIGRSSLHRDATGVTDLTKVPGNVDVSLRTLSIDEDSVTDSGNDEIKLIMANLSERYASRTFRLHDLRGKAVPIRFAVLKSQDIHYQVKALNRWLLDVKAPPNGLDSSDSFKFYAPPPKPSMNMSSRRALLSSESRKASRDYDKRKRYIFEYALWYTAQCRWDAVCRQCYVFCDSYGTILNPAQTCEEEWEKWLKPETHVKVLLRGLNMLTFKMEGKTYQVVNTPEYVKDVEDAFKVHHPDNR